MAVEISSRMSARTSNNYDSKIRMITQREYSMKIMSRGENDTTDETLFLKH